MTQYALLQSSLDCAVPLRIHELQECDWDYLQLRIGELQKVLAEKAEYILFTGQKKGDTAQAFNSLAEAIACLAFVPGGIRIFGRHWEAKLKGEV